ncbi:MAG: ArsR/SmtB family transcription factor [Gammaproteobacteria bacterium]|jgi:ArsR family transcriptional regulator, virulence genes transcriptional regulator
MNASPYSDPAAAASSGLDPAAMARHAAEAAALLRALANEQRLLVLCHLAGGELSVGQLLGRVALSQSALSQHLAILREGGFVHARRQAQQVFYALADGPARQVMQTLHALYCAQDRR